jgi:glycosyltransferase involved in cell wall biosynthesis
MESWRRIMVPKGYRPLRLVSSESRLDLYRQGAPFDLSPYSPMTVEQTSGTVPMVLHVIPSQLARGAQREARAVVDHLSRPGVRSDRVLSMFGGSSAVAVDWSLDHPGGSTPGMGLDPRLVFRLRSRLGELDPAAVVAHGSEPLKYLLPAMIGRRRPLVYNAIGTYSGSDRPAQQRIWRFLLARPDLVVAVGEEVRTECIERFGVPDDRVVFVPNGRDPAVFRPGPERPPPTLPRLIFVGALVDGKRPRRFIDAVSRLRAAETPFSAAMIGDGPLRQDLGRPAGEAQVELLGGRSDVPDLLGQADVLVFTSLPPGEGMPGVLIEAGLSGLPVVATDVPGVRTIVRDRETGFIVDVEDMEGLVACTAKLLADPELRSTMGRAARRHCLDKFAIDSVAEQWSIALQPLLTNARSPRSEK